MKNKKLKVLATVPSGFCFGLQHITIDFFAASKKEIEPFFLVTKWSNGDFEKMLAAKGFSYSYSWLGMFSRKLDWYNLKMSLEAFVKLPALYSSYLKLIKKHKPDILFFANHHELILLLPVLWITKTKVVCHMHDPSPAIPFQIKTFKQYGKRVNKFIAISNSVKDRLMQLGCSADKIEVVPNGIHLPDLIVKRQLQFIQSAGWNASDFIIGITGQMTETKGHEDVIEAFELAYKSNKQLRLVIGGKPLEPYYAHLQELVKNKELKQVVFFSGWLEDANDFYRNIDIFIMASRHEEGYGLVVAEAMACEKPVIITNSGGATEIVENGISGFIVEKRDIVEMANHINLLAIDKGIYRSMQKAAYQRIKNTFFMSEASKKFISVLKSTANN